MGGQAELSSLPIRLSATSDSTIMAQDQMTLRGTLEGHGGWVTQIATTSAYPNMVLSASRDKSLIMWNLVRDEQHYGMLHRSLTGHGHHISDVVMSSDGPFALSACKYTISEDCHNDWVSCVRFSPNTEKPIIVSAGWDKTVKVWNLANCKLKTNHYGHQGYLNCVTVSPDGSLCASGGKDKKTMLWDLNEGKHLYTLDGGDTINSLCFSPNRYWLCAATGPSIQIWDLEGKAIVDEVRPEVFNTSSRAEPPQCISLAWSSDGQTLFAGYTDNMIRVW